MKVSGLLSFERVIIPGRYFRADDLLFHETVINDDGPIRN